MTIESINPATSERIARYDALAPKAIEQTIDDVHAAYVEWRLISFDARAKPMRNAAAILRNEKRALARLMAEEMGKPIRDGVGEIDKCAAACEFFAEHARVFLAAEPVKTEARASAVHFNPLGVVLAVMPWNFPFWQVFRFAAPALMAGNGAVLKHASNVPGCAMAIEDIFRRSGFPENLFRTLMIESAQVSSALEHRHVRAATLTGSSDAGRSIAKKAGELLKKTVLELGGSDPYLVLEDADLELAARVCTKARLVNSGQSCIAGKRFIVVDAIRRPFEERFVAHMREAKLGDPLNEDTEIGPMARWDLRETLHRQVQSSLARGARCLLGGSLPSGAGAYYPATVLTDVRKGMPAFDEELFGPVAAVVPVKNEEEAIAAANDSSFGLGAAVITRDVRRGEQIAAERIASGSVFVNDAVRSDQRLPFGGIKESGYGRELSAYGIREFVNIKTVVVA